jgi:hypothetical protein
MSSFKIREIDNYYAVFLVNKNGLTLLSRERSKEKAEERLKYHRGRDSHGHTPIKDSSVRNIDFIEKEGKYGFKLKEVV